MRDSGVDGAGADAGVAELELELAPAFAWGERRESVLVGDCRGIWGVLAAVLLVAAGELRRVAFSRQFMTWASRRVWKLGSSRDGNSW